MEMSISNSNSEKNNAGSFSIDLDRRLAILSACFRLGLMIDNGVPSAVANALADLRDNKHVLAPHAALHIDGQAVPMQTIVTSTNGQASLTIVQKLEAANGMDLKAIGHQGAHICAQQELIAPSGPVNLQSKTANGLASLVVESPIVAESVILRAEGKQSTIVAANDIDAVDNVSVVAISGNGSAKVKVGSIRSEKGSASVILMSNDASQLSKQTFMNILNGGRKRQ
jgi:hypothetical protein